MAVWILFDGNRLYGPLVRSEVDQFISRWGSSKKSLFISHVDYISWLPLEIWHTLCRLETDDAQEFVRIAGDEGLLRKNLREVMGPYDYSDLSSALQNIDSFDRLELKLSKVGLWIPFVLFPHLIRSSGKRVRQHARVLVDGSMHILQSNTKHTARLIDLSEGGCAAAVDKRLTFNQQSPAQLLVRGIDEPLLMALEALPNQPTDGRLSFRFSSLEERYRQAITELIRRQIFMRFEAMMKKAA